MKTNDVWGINCADNKYWLFNKNFSVVVKLPGESSDKIDLRGSGVTLPNFPLFFDNFGRPYFIYDAIPVTYDANPLTIRIESTEDTSIVRKLSITPETGLIVVTQ
jgi:hypothetical protein